MSKLIHLRQRIRAIETIKKITHAMRLIAMSSHLQLRHSQRALTTYNQKLETLITHLAHYAPHWHNPIFYPDHKSSQCAVILISSQKGLCGNFNTALFRKALQELNQLTYPDIDIFTVGQKATEFLMEHPLGELRHSYDKISSHRIPTIAYELSHAIMHKKPHYQAVYIISNQFKNFFLQIPRIISIIPFTSAKHTEEPSSDDLIWEQDPHAILNDLAPIYLTARIHAFMVESLLAEQAARFISMDSATRNANNLLDSTRLEYNKLRQAKITKELIELSGSYEF